MSGTQAPVRSIEDMTPDEIEQYLAKKRKAEKAAAEKERKAYEEERDYVVNTIFGLVEDAHDFLMTLHKTCHVEMEKQSEALANYGKLPKSSKGGFSIDNADRTLRITRTRATKPHWDERSKKGVEILKDFLATTAKKRDAKLYNLLMGFLEKNQAGELEYSRVMLLLKHEGEFNEPEWVEGIRLLKEGYSNYFEGYGYQFKKKNASGKWETVLLNFSGL